MAKRRYKEANGTLRFKNVKRKHSDFKFLLQNPTTSMHECQFVSVTFSMRKSLPSLTNLAVKWVSCQIGFFGKSWNLWNLTGLVSITIANMGLLPPPSPFSGVFLHCSQDLNHHVTLLSACQLGGQRAVLLDKRVIGVQNSMNKTTEQELIEH